jgi:hypothetical protein
MSRLLNVKAPSLRRRLGLAALVASGLIASVSAGCEGPGEALPDARQIVDEADAAPPPEPDASTITTIDTALAEGPPAFTSSGVAYFEFEATAEATYTCVLDGGPPFACTSPLELDVGEGEHTLVVTATSTAAPFVVDPSPLVITWTVDQTLPTGAVDAGPTGLTNDPIASFELSASEAMVTYLCALDGGAFVPCDATWEAGPLADGPHVVVILVVDAAGNVSDTPLVRTWTLDATAPVIEFVLTPTDPSEDPAPMITFVVDEPADATCALTGQVASACDGEFAAPVLANGAQGFTVTAVDAAGNVGTASLDWLLDVVTWAAAPPAAPRAPAPGALGSTQLAFDEQRGEVVAFLADADVVGGEGQTWLWDGAAWRQHAGVDPPERVAGSLTYHAGSGKVVLFGGQDDGATTMRGDTWLWDGASWTLVTPAVSPPARQLHATVYDPSRDEVLLFGGRTTSVGSYIGDTWRWDGDAWTEALPSAPPAGRGSAVMAYDAARGEVVLFGGYNNWALNDGRGYFRQTWTWDGDEWTHRTEVTNRPTMRWMPGMAYDAARGEVVMFGGYDFDLGIYRDETWIWNGVDWALRPTSPTPAPRYAGALTYNSVRQEVFLVGGVSTVMNGHTVPWHWDGVAWSNRTPPAGPNTRFGAGVAYDEGRDETTIFGGQRLPATELTDTWSLDRQAWIPRSPFVAPSGNAGPAMAYDPVRDEVILFGGASAGIPLDETWRWNGDQWEQLAPGTVPPARRSAALVFDQTRGELVMFGGAGDSGDLGDTWRWDGSDWAEATPATSPSARRAMAAAYHPGTETVVISGGDTVAGVSDETWTWDGTTWTEASPVLAPPARSDATLAADPGRDALVLFGGRDALGVDLADTWIWDGAAWTARSPAAPPSARHAAMATFDLADGAVVLFGGEGAGGTLGDVSRLR